MLFVTLLAVGAGAVSASSSSSARAVITPSPAYTADQLNAPPGDNWLTNMGSLNGNRYSSLKQIDKSNVATLKQAWKINLGTCKTKDDQCGSLEANAAVANGTYYIQTPKSDVFALDAATGATLWHWAPTYDPSFSVGSGGRQPGVAIADGKVFAPTDDGYLVALDQMMGGLVWKSEVLPWKKGGRVSDAPIYVNGIVITGDSCGDCGSPSNGMHAYDANTGRELWTWAIVPGPGQPGSNTWSGNGALYGGGAMWESPVIDTKRNLAIFGTGNPVPWNSRGPGMNLYTDSIVALNLYTGQLVWAYQTTHHDLWDSDLPNNGVMFDAPYKVPFTATVKVKGKTKKVTRFHTVVRPAVAFVSKYGMTFVLDRETGKPLIPVKEVKVPQSSAPEVNTWPTQPVSSADNVLFNKQNAQGLPCTDGAVSQTNAYVPYSSATAPDGKPYKIGCVYDPYDTTQYVVFPFEMMDWPASSYSPENKTFITCGVSDRAVGLEQIPSASQVVGSFGGVGVAVLFGGDTSTANTGNFSALNVTTGKLAWHQHWAAPCYSGSMNTASGITFIGHLGEGNAQDGHGYLEAVDTATGASLWKSPPMSAPVGAAPVTYMVNGKQYVSVAVGGQAHNDVSRPAGLTNPLRLRDDAIYTFALP
ncbi:MAG: outer membrane protein assembly factor BamB family protein [Gaiellaceae bacterium]